jgi:hypothetical protein
VTLSRTPETPALPSTTTPVPPTTPSDPTTPSGQPTPAAQPVPPLAFVTTRLPSARVGRAYRAEIRFTGTVSEARVDRRLPLGLRWRVRPGRIVITGRVRTGEAGRFATVLSGDDSSVRRQFRLRVR